MRHVALVKPDRSLVVISHPQVHRSAARPCEELAHQPAADTLALGFVQQIRRSEGDYLILTAAENPNDLRPGSDDTAKQQVRLAYDLFNELSSLSNALCGDNGPSLLADPRLIHAYVPVGVAAANIQVRWGFDAPSAVCSEREAKAGPAGSMLTQC